MATDPDVAPDSRTRLDFGILGPVVASRAGTRIDIGPVKQRGVLAALLLNANRPTSVVSILDAVWGDDAPATAPKMVQVFISRLRAALSDEVTTAISTSGRSYQITVDSQALDLLRSRSLAAEAQVLRSHDPLRALALLDRALAEWRGAPLIDLLDLPLAVQVAASLREEHMNLRDARIDALITCDRLSDAISELHREIELEPYRETARSRLMLALYRSGRQVAALEVFTEYRELLSSESGLDPSPDILRLHGQILRQDPELRVGESWKGEPAKEPPPKHPPRTRIRLRPILAVAVAVIAVVVAVVLVVSLSSPRTTAARITANAIVEIDDSSGTIIKDVPAGTSPGAVAVSAGFVWSASGDDKTITQADENSGRVVGTYGLPDPPVSLAAGPEIVWIGDGFDGKLSRLLVSSRQISDPFFPARSVTGLVAVAESPSALWVGLSDHSLVELDPRSLRSEATFRLPLQPLALATQGTVVWAIGSHSGSVFRTDSRTGSLASVRIGGEPHAMAQGFGSIWIAESSPNRLIRLSASGHIVATYPLGAYPSAVATTVDSVWVAEGNAGVLERVDPTGRRVRTTVTIGRTIGGIAGSGSRLWLTAD